MDLRDQKFPFKAIGVMERIRQILGEQVFVIPSEKFIIPETGYIDESWITDLVRKYNSIDKDRKDDGYDMHLPTFQYVFPTNGFQIKYEKLGLLEIIITQNVFSLMMPAIDDQTPLSIYWRIRDNGTVAEAKMKANGKLSTFISYLPDGMASKASNIAILLEGEFGEWKDLE